MKKIILLGAATLLLASCGMPEFQAPPSKNIDYPKPPVMDSSSKNGPIIAQPGDKEIATEGTGAAPYDWEKDIPSETEATGTALSGSIQPTTTPANIQ